MAINVLIYCGYRLFAEGLQKLLEEDKSMRIVGIHAGDEGVSGILQNDPDVIVADLPSCNFLVNNYEKKLPAKTILITDDRKAPFGNGGLQKLIAKGLVGIFHKSYDSDLLKKAIATVHAGELWIDRKTLTESLSSSQNAHKKISLTKKEKEILDCICEGMTNKETAEKLSISELTVKSHCNHLFKKFGVSNRLKLALLASQMDPSRLA